MVPARQVVLEPFLLLYYIALTMGAAGGLCSLIAELLPMRDRGQVGPPALARERERE